MDTKTELEILQRIERVAPPSYLFTRISAKLDAHGEQCAPLTWKLAFAAVIALVASMNVFLLNSELKSNITESERSSFIEEAGLIKNNQLYHD